MDEATHRLGDVREMTPHLEPAWVETFVVEQRLLGVPGERIGDALATVESHVAESGETALGAFGDPRSYAREMSQPAHRQSPSVDRVTVVGSVAALLAIILVPRALGAWLRGEEVSVTVGDLMVLVLLVGFCAVLFLASGPVVRLLVDHRWAAAVALPLVVGSFVAALLLLPAQVTSLPVWLVAAAGLAALAAEVVTFWRQPSDVVTAPRAAVLAPGAAGPAPDGRSPLLALVLGPGLVAVMCLLTWVTELAA